MIVVNSKRALGLGRSAMESTWRLLDLVKVRSSIMHRVAIS